MKTPISPTTTSTPPHAFSRLGAVRHVFSRLAVSAVMALAASVAQADSCAFRSGLPRSEGFLSSYNGDYRMILWERLGGATFGGTEIPIHLSFTPILGYQGSPILGQGFLLMPFDATCVQKGGNTFEMTQPSGHVITLEKTRNAKVWKSQGWTAEVSGAGAGQVIKAESSCGWTILYSGGRLAQMISPAKEIFDFSSDPKGTHQVNRNGRKLIGLRRDFDKKTTLPIWHLDFTSADGPKHAVFKMAPRPVLVALPNKKTRTEGRRSLASIQFDNQPERRYSFKIDELDRAGYVYKWDPTNYQLLSEGDKKYSFVKLHGIHCFKTTYPDGKFELHGYSSDGKIDISTTGIGLPTLCEYTVPLADGAGRVKKVSNINPDGTLELVSRYWYDEKGTIVRSYFYDPQNKVKYERDRNVLIAYKTQKNEPVWKKIYDDQKRLKEFHKGEKKYHFNYLNDDEVRVTTFKQGVQISDTVLAFSKIAHITRNPDAY
jgi:hypothetical protein